MAKKLIGLFLLLYIIFNCDYAFPSTDKVDSHWEPREGKELIGRAAPGLFGLKWLNVNPIEMDDLKGRVVLIRFWLTGCPFCINTAPSLNELYQKYRDEGLFIIGIHHPKSEMARDPELVTKAAKTLGFRFPIALDNDWKVINRYWLGGNKRSYTSSSFLIDKQGVIRFIHDGGEFYRSETNKEANSAYTTLDLKIQELLNE